jgi:hypothetical protein
MKDCFFFFFHIANNLFCIHAELRHLDQLQDKHAAMSRGGEHRSAGTAQGQHLGLPQPNGEPA